MPVTKTVDVSGTSTDSIEAAIRTALSRMAMTVNDIESFEVTKIGGSVTAAGIHEYRVWIKVTFVVREQIHE